MSNALTTDRVGVTTDSDILAADYNNARSDLHSTAEGFWDDGTPDIPSSMRVKGVHWSDPTSKALRLFRQTAIGADSRAMSSPIRPIWHYDDQTGEPAIDARAVEGDLLLWDDGTNDRFLKSHNGAAWYGVGVRADYRTAATATSGTTQNQASDRVSLRASRWDTSGTPAAKYREWSLQAGTSSSASDSYSLLTFSRLHEGGARTTVATLDTNGWLYLVGAQPGVELASGGVGVAYAHITSTDPDGSIVKLRHASATRWGKFRYQGTTTGTTGSGAEVLAVAHRTDADGSTTTRNSPSFAWVGSYWDGAAAQEAKFWSQHILDATTPASHLRIGSYGTGTLDFYSDGGVRITQDPAGSSSPAGQLQLNTSVAATSGAKTSPGGAFSSIGYSWDGAASQPRVMGWYTNVDDPADATDVWSHRLIAVGGGSPVDVMFATSAGWLGLGASPAVAAHITETTTITGGVTDGYTASLRLQPTITAATAQTVTRHNYLDVKNVTLAGAGPAALTDACFARFDAAAGTHKAVDASTTKTTPGGVDAWVKVNINGTIHYMPAFLSKTA